MTDQDEVVAFLASPALHDGRRPQRVETHISLIFLGRERVYKLKKALALSFLDFSTLAARRLACAREVELNRRTAPDLYLGAVPVIRLPDGRLALGVAERAEDAEQAVEWVVAMRRFESDTLFDRLARRHALDAPLLLDLAETVAAFHRAAPVRTDGGGAAGLAWVLDSNARGLAGLMPDPLPPEAVARLLERQRAGLAGLAPFLEGRRERGLVRQCHGDLHLGNICLFQGRPTLFDAIEFSDEIACIDVFYDLAFLVMDLDVRAGRPLASLVLNRVLDLSGDYDGMRALPLFLSVRATVRALVWGMTARAQKQTARRRTQGAQARRYLEAAQAYLAPSRPRVVAIGGLSGSGKSHLARLLAPALGMPGAAVVRSDALRKRICGVGLTARLGPEGYAPDVTRRVYQTLTETCAALVAGGCPVIADAVFADPAERAAIERVALAAGARFDGLWLEASETVAAARVAARAGDASDATPAVAAAQRAYDPGAIDWSRIDTSGGSGAVSAARRILEI